MQPLYDLLPVLAFFVTYSLKGIYAATAVLIIGTVAQVLVQWLRHRRVQAMTLISAGLVLLLGGLTLWLHNDLLIMWKPTVLYALFAAILLASQFTGKVTVVERLLGKQLSANTATWRIANASWAIFFTVLALVNLYFVYETSRDTWVKWKLATLGIVFGFAVLQAVWLSRRAQTNSGES
jgi:intracellular septation protein